MSIFSPGDAAAAAALGNSYRDKHKNDPPYRSGPSTYPNIPNTRAFGADDYNGISMAGRIWLYENGFIDEDPTKEDSSGGSPGGGSSGGSSGSSAYGNSDMQAYIDYMNAVTDKNNAWAAAQADKQMGFQEYMASTQYQRGVADLKAAGLNPVLAAGSGQAAAASGAMATPDTSNSRAIAELALSAIDALGTTAVGLASGFSGAKGDGSSSGFNWDKAASTVTNVVNTIFRSAINSKRYR